jgi:hypothetical protein
MVPARAAGISSASARRRSVETRRSSGAAGSWRRGGRAHLQKLRRQYPARHRWQPPSSTRRRLLPPRLEEPGRARRGGLRPRRRKRPGLGTRRRRVGARRRRMRLVSRRPRRSGAAGSRRRPPKPWQGPRRLVPQPRLLRLHENRPARAERRREPLVAVVRCRPHVELAREATAATRSARRCGLRSRCCVRLDWIRICFSLVRGFRRRVCPAFAA